MKHRNLFPDLTCVYFGIYQKTGMHSKNSEHAHENSKNQDFDAMKIEHE